MSAAFQQSLPIAFAAWIIFSSIRRALHSGRPAPVRNPNPCEWTLLGVHLAGGALIGAVLVRVTIGLFSPNMIPAIGLLGGAVLISVATDAVGLLKGFRANRVNFRKAAIQGGALFIAGLTGLTALIAMRTIPGSVERLEIRIPIEGRWRVEAGGRFGLTNSHHGNPDSQNLALDLVKEGGPEASLGQPVQAPMDGKILKVVGKRLPDEEDPEGNVVVIRNANGVDLMLAHLQENSVRVSEGQMVHAGEIVANCGGTGSATTAHLHIHAQHGEFPVALLMGPAKKFFVRGDVIDSYDQDQP